MQVTFPTGHRQHGSQLGTIDIQLVMTKTQIRGICKMHSAIEISSKYQKVERERIKM